MKVYKANNFSDIYSNILQDLIDPTKIEHVSSPRYQKINENLNVCFELNDPKSCLYHNVRRSSQYNYIAAEIIYYFMGRNDLKFIEKYAKFWKHIANSDDTINSAYGYLIFKKLNLSGISQWQWALESLEKDKDTRQAFMHFNLPDHQYFSNKDQVCTLSAIFHIRENKLNFTVNMRSNDAVLGLPTDVAFFCLLQQQMLKHLKVKYPELKLGKYTHFVNSMHIYEKHFQLVMDMLNHPFDKIKMYPLDVNLIDKMGEPTPELKEFHDSLIVNSTYDKDKSIFIMKLNELLSNYNF